MAEGKIHAQVELRMASDIGGDKTAHTAQTNERGTYDFSPVSPGEYVLHISAVGYQSYEAKIYLPSDFECRLAVLLKKEGRGGEKPEK